MRNLSQKIASKNHTITVEISPPKGTDVTLFLDYIRPIAHLVDGLNVPDCQRAILKMSSLAASKILQDELGIEAVWQLTGRDRNIVALQSDLLGAWALGIKNVLALTGDPVQVGDQAEVAKQVGHLDALRLLELIQTLNQNRDAVGHELKKGGTQFCYGAALNAHRMSREAQIHRLKLKLIYGVQFFQTQPIYDIKTLQDAYQTVNTLCEELRCPVPKIMVGIIPPKSADFARFMNQKILGIDIPESFIQILERSPNPIQESIRFCADLVQEMAPYAGGFHFMPVGLEKHALPMLEACLAPGHNLKRLKAL